MTTGARGRAGDGALPAPRPRSVLHLVRRPGEAPPPGAVRPGDAHAILDETPPERLLDLLAAHELAIVWGPSWPARGAVTPGGGPGSRPSGRR